jgi:replicative DNA helicase
MANVDVPVAGPSEVVDVSTFCAGEDSYDWLVPGLIERNDRIVIVAAEASGKSMMLRQIAITCAFGIHPFGTRHVEPARTLLVDFENPESLIRRKLRPMLAQARHLRPQADPAMMGVLCRPGGIDVTSRTDARWLAAQLTAAQPELVVAGPLYKMFSADDKWEQGARAVTTILDDLRTRLGFALVLETHAPQAFGGHRNLRPIGSSLWLRWPEFGLSFAPLDDHPEVVKVKAWKARDERFWPEYLQRGGVWPWTPCRDPGGPQGQMEPPPRQENRAAWDQGEF